VAIGLSVSGLAAFFYGIFGAGVNPGLAVLIGILPLALGLAVQWPVLALIGMTVMISAQVSENLTASFGLPSTLDLAVPGAALVLLLRYATVADRPALSGRAAIGLCALLIFSAISVLYARNWRMAETTTISLAKDLVVVFLILTFIDRPERLRVFLATVVATFAALCALGIFWHVSPGEGTLYGFVKFAFVERRFTGPYPDANFFASYLALALPVALGLALAARIFLHDSFPILMWLVVGIALSGHHLIRASPSPSTER
jgi:hypothetical protein